METTVLTDYRTFEEQRKSIQEEYALLREEAQKQGDEKRVTQINKAEKEALSALNTSFLQQSDSWKQLFSDLDTLSAAQISQLVKDIEKELASGNLKLSPVDYKAVIDSLNQAKERLEKLNPFAALSSQLEAYNKAKKALEKAKKDGNEDDISNAQRAMKSAANGIASSIIEITEVASKCGNDIQSVFDSLGMDGVADAMGTALSLMNELGNAAASVGKIMAGDIIGGVTGIISSITSVVNIFNSLHDAKYEKQIKNLQKQLDGLERSYSRLEKAYNNTYWVFTDEQRAGYERNIQLIESQIAALERQKKVAEKSWNYTQYESLTAQIKKLNKELDNAKMGGDMLSIHEQQKQNLQDQIDLIEKQKEAESSKKKGDKDKIQKWDEQIEDIKEQMAELDQQMRDTFAGTTTKEAIDEFADAIVEAYCSGEDAAKALGETTKKVLKNAVVEALKRQFLAKAMDEAVNFLGEAMSDGVLTKEEKEQFENLTKKAGETFTNALEAVGDMDEDTISDPLAGAVASMSEETAGVIAGRLNAFIINQTDQTNILREQLLAQSEIAKNTATANNILSNIESVLIRIENKDNSLLSQGIS